MLKHENGLHVAGAAPGACAGAGPPRANWPTAGRGNNVKAYAKHTNLRSTVVFGGIDMKPQTAGTEGRRGSADRHTGPPAGPHRGQELRAQPSGVRGPGRSRPHAGHRLPARPAARSCPTCRASARRCCFRPLSRPKSSAWPTATCRTRCWWRWPGPNATADQWWSSASYSVTDDDKRRVVMQLLRVRGRLTQAIVFVNSKLGAARLARVLSSATA